MFKFIERYKQFTVYLPLTVYWVTLFVFTSLPAAKLPNVGVNDKIEHLSAFFGLGFLLNLMFSYQETNQFLKKHFNLGTIALGLLYGAFDELHQKLVPGRSCDFYDWVSDSTGILIAVVCLFLVRKLSDVTSKAQALK